MDDLRTVRVQQDDGSSVDTPGNAVEPVQLQVVCQRLWSGLSADDMTIGLDDVEALGDVSKALEGYFDEQVAAIAAGRVDLERTIRDWFEAQLITAQGIRTQVAQEPGATRGLDNAVIEQLVQRRLVRSERRRVRQLVRAGPRPADPPGAGQQRDLAADASGRLAAAGYPVGRSGPAARPAVERQQTGRGRTADGRAIG